jgi:hypothetical protein
LLINIRGSKIQDKIKLTQHNLQHKYEQQRGY